MSDYGSTAHASTDVVDRDVHAAGDVHKPMWQHEFIKNPFVRGLLAFGRILIGWTFMWPFIDKVFGLGFGTPAERAWVNGGTPAQGFMGRSEGPFGGFFRGMADSLGAFNDWFFMLGLFGIGLAMLLGAGLKLAAWGGTILLFLMYLAEFPWGQGPEFHATNPITDSHWIEAALLLISAYTLSGDTFGLGKWWGSKVGNGWLR